LCFLYMYNDHFGYLIVSRRSILYRFPVFNIWMILKVKYVWSLTSHHVSDNVVNTCWNGQ